MLYLLFISIILCFFIHNLNYYVYTCNTIILQKLHFDIIDIVFSHIYIIFLIIYPKNIKWMY